MQFRSEPERQQGTHVVRVVPTPTVVCNSDVVPCPYRLCFSHCHRPMSPLTKDMASARLECVAATFKAGPNWIGARLTLSILDRL